LEKAVGDTLPNSIKKIEPIIKKVSSGFFLGYCFMIHLLSNISVNVDVQIAKYQAPGRYILKPEVDLESLNKPQIESGRCPLFIFLK